MKSLPARLPVLDAWNTGAKNVCNFRFLSKSGRQVVVTVECSVEQYLRWYSGEDSVERAFPLLSEESKELFRSGMGPVELKHKGVK